MLYRGMWFGSQGKEQNFYIYKVFVLKLGSMYVSVHYIFDSFLWLSEMLIVNNMIVNINNMPKYSEV